MVAEEEVFAGAEAELELGSTCIVGVGGDAKTAGILDDGEYVAHAGATLVGEGVVLGITDFHRHVSDGGCGVEMWKGRTVCDGGVRLGCCGGC